MFFLAKRTLKEQQQKLVEGYKVGHVRRIIWYRILSVLSAITVFCTTYAMILPALTQEDPTVGVKLAREFYYENDDVAIIFTVTGRAIFKDEHIQIEDPQADLVELEVIELAEGDYVYEQFSEHLEESIGAEDLAQMFALELKFSYLGNELDTKRCDIIAQIKAKEEFFTDEIGDVPQNTEPEADHPMAEPSLKSEPAMALTAIQGTGTNVFDAPTVYTTDTQEVSTLTVDVKGSALALATSNTANPTYTVQYYANITTIDNTISESEATSLGYKGIDVINTAGKVAPGSAPIVNYYLKPLASVTGKSYEFVTNTELVPVYNSVAGLYYAGASNYPFLDRISTSSAPYELKEIWRLVNPEAEASTNPEDWEIYGVDANLSEYFTNNSSAANSSKILIEEGDVIRLVYEESKDLSSVSQDLTMYDYDVSDGYLYASNTLATAAGSEISSQSTSTAYMKTTDVLNTTTTTYYIDGYCGINSFVSGSGSVKFAFGDNKIGTGLDSQTWNGQKLNASANSNNGVFGLVENISLGSDFTPIFNSTLKVPELFTNYNDHDFERTNQQTTKSVFSTNTVAYYDGSNNSGAINGTPANNATFTVNHDKESTTWQNLMGSTSRNFIVAKNENAFFTDDAYRVSGSKIYLPAQIGTDLNNAKVTVELEFGDIRKSGNGDVILFADETGTKQFCLSIESGRLRFWKNGSCVMDLPNGYELAAYSTISIVQVVESQNVLYIYCDGDPLLRGATSGRFNVPNKRFYIGSDTSAHIIEYRSIRIHSGGNLSPSAVCVNARYNHTRSYLATKTNPGTGTGTNHSDTGGKNVIGGRDIVFNRVGDVYTLTSINNTNLTNSNIENLQYFNQYTKDGITIISNDFWPMDKAGTFGSDGNDIKFGSSSLELVDKRKVFGRLLSTPANLPTSFDGADHNSYFGFKHKFDFTVDADYCGPINFFFYGDDDVWVFLDDGDSGTAPVLVCDLGGVHNPVGEFVNLRDYIPEGTEGNYSLYMFYLERGGSQSTAYMRMTVPMASVTLPNPEDTNVEMEEPPAVLEINNTLEITNTVNNIDAPQPFSYLIKLFDENGNALTGSYDYKRFTSITGVETDITGTQTFENQGEDGIAFEIPHGHKLVFYNLPAGTQYLITQITRNGFYTSYTINDNEVIKGNVDRYGNVTDEDTVLSGVLVDNKVVEIDFYNTNYAELPSTGFDGENSVLMYYVPFGIATVYMCAMPFINRTKKPKKGDELEQA